MLEDGSVQAMEVVSRLNPVQERVRGVLKGLPPAEALAVLADEMARQLVTLPFSDTEVRSIAALTITQMQGALMKRLIARAGT